MALIELCNFSSPHSRLSLRDLLRPHHFAHGLVEIKEKQELIGLQPTTVRCEQPYQALGRAQNNTALPRGLNLNLSAQTSMSTQWKGWHLWVVKWDGVGKLRGNEEREGRPSHTKPLSLLHSRNNLESISPSPSSLRLPSAASRYKNDNI